LRGALARVPLHVTGFWKPVLRPDKLSSGSIGAGLVLSPGITVRLKLCSHSEVRLNGRPLRLRSLSILLDRLGAEACIDAWSPAPLGAGYGVSASLTLGAAAALAATMGLPLSRVFREAHVAEVEAGTGLGDVAAVIDGGYLELRLKAGAPGVGLVETLPLDTSLEAVTVPLGYEDTSHMLREMPGEAYSMVSDALRTLSSRPRLSLFLQYSYRFSRAAGMMTSMLEEALREACTGCLGFYVKKRVAVLLAMGRSAWTAASRLEEKLGVKPIVLKPSPGGVMVFSLE